MIDPKPYTNADFQRFLGREPRCALAPYCEDANGNRPCEACQAIEARRSAPK